MTNTEKIVRDVIARLPYRRPCIEVVDPLMVPVLRIKTPAERLAIAWGMWHFARDTLRRSIAAQHPEWPDEEVNRAATRRLVHES